MLEARPTQEQKIRAYLEARAGEWVPSYVFAMEMGILQYGARIKTLREKGLTEGFEVENRVEYEGGKVKGAFRWKWTRPKQMELL